MFKYIDDKKYYKVLETSDHIVYFMVDKDDRFNGQQYIEYKEEV